MKNNEKKEWTNAYAKSDMPFPSEYVIRMFKGKYPNCDLKLAGGYKGKRLLDISCGIGRDLVLFNQLGFEELAATEITEDIVRQAEKEMNKLNIPATIRVGRNSDLPFEERYFDYVLSWNVCYYLDADPDFSKHVKEYARVMKKDGILVFSIPKPDCFIYKNGIKKENGLIEITNDPFGVRNGITLKCFSNEEEIVEEFGSCFKDFGLAIVGA